MDFESSIKFLSSLDSRERTMNVPYNEKYFSLDGFRRFLKNAQIDYGKLKYVHVAGSKGKGSVSKMAADYLQLFFGVKKKIGLYTSPHLIDVTERIKINGRQISRVKFAKYASQIKVSMEKIGKADLTYFEAVTAIMFKYFLDEKVDFAVLEVGLGGNLDSTNVIKPEVSALTKVEVEHRGILGKNIREILDKKLGIYKVGVPFIVGLQSGRVMNLIREKMNGKKLIFVKKRRDVFLKSFDKAKMENAFLAHKIISVLLGKVNGDLFKKMFEKFKMDGRVDVRKIAGVTVVFDIAHTVSSVKNLVSFLKKTFPKKKFIFLVSLMKGKEISKIAKVISQEAPEIIFTNSNEIRGIPGVELKKIFSRISKRKINLKAIEGVRVAYKYALKNALKKGRILVVTGSSFLVGKIYAA